MNIPTATQKTGGVENVYELYKQNKQFWISDSIEEDFKIHAKVKKAFKLYGTKYAVMNHLVDTEKVTAETASKWIEKTLQFQMVTYSELLLRDFHVQILLERIADTYRAAEEAGDLVARNAANAQYSNIIEKFLGTNALIDLSKLVIVKQELNFNTHLSKELPEYDSEEYKAIINNLKEYKKKKNQMMMYTDFEEIKQGDEHN